MTASPHGTDDPREIVDDLEQRARAEATTSEEGADPAEAKDKKESPDLADGDQDDVAPKVPGSPEPPD